MNKFLSIFILLAGLLMLSNTSFADPLTVSPDDNMSTLLSKHKDKRVTVQLNSGEKLTGKVTEVTDTLVVLQELAGQEFYDAAINLKKIAAVIVRAREK